MYIYTVYSARCLFWNMGIENTSILGWVASQRWTNRSNTTVHPQNHLVVLPSSRSCTFFVSHNRCPHVSAMVLKKKNSKTLPAPLPPHHCRHCCFEVASSWSSSECWYVWTPQPASVEAIMEPWTTLTLQRDEPHDAQKRMPMQLSSIIVDYNNEIIWKYKSSFEQNLFTTKVSSVWEFCARYGPEISSCVM